MRMGRALHSMAVAGLIAFAQLAAVQVASAAPPPRVIVKFRTPAADKIAFDAQAQALVAAQRRAGVTLAPVRRTAAGADVLRSDRPMSRAQMNDLVAALAADPQVEYAEEDRLLKRAATPNDSRYHEQWQYFEAAAGINAPPAWDNATGTGVRVAVIDTGYRPHADLATNIVGGYDFISEAAVANDGDLRDGDASDPGDWTEVDECAAGDPGADSSWHGTHVAGIVAALTNNGTGVAGTAHDARVVPIRVLGRCGGYLSDVADGVVWAAGGTVSDIPENPNPARIISMSLGGGGGCDTTMQNAIDAARGRGAAVIVAAGNQGADAANFMPANCAGVIAVAAVTRAGGRTFYTNFGPMVAVAAPGGDSGSAAADNILSTLNEGTTTPAADNYAAYAGTSMATPQVAGVAALMLQADPTLTPDQIVAILQSTARAFPAPCDQCGSGIVNAAAAVAAAAQGGDGDGGSCPAGYTAHTGTLSARGSTAYQPGSRGYSVTVSGRHVAKLTGPSSANLDLFLQKKRGFLWRPVALSNGNTATESINYQGGAGSYRWRVIASRGAGNFLLCTQKP